MRRSRRAATADDNDTGIDMTPMLDIVFIMLIFFIVTTSFIKVSGIEVNRPQASTAEPEERVNIMVAIDPNGAIWIDGRQVELGGVRATVERLRAQNPKGSVVVDADADARTGRLVQVMDRIRAAGVESVSIASDEGEA